MVGRNSFLLYLLAALPRSCFNTKISQHFQEQLGFGSGFISGAVTFAQHLAWLRGNVTTLRGTVDEDRTAGERSDEELADMIMEAKRQCNVKHRDEK